MNGDRETPARRANLRATGKGRRLKAAPVVVMFCSIPTSPSIPNIPSKNRTNAPNVAAVIHRRNPTQEAPGHFDFHVGRIKASA